MEHLSAHAGTKPAQALRKKHWQSLLSGLAAPDNWSFPLVERPELVSSCQHLFRRFGGKKSFFHVGMGGSALGPKMLVSGFQKSGVRFEFIDNIDPVHLGRQLEKVVWEESLFYIVSKSGQTAETLANLAVIVRYLRERGYAEKDFANFFVFATSATSPLLDLGQQWGVEVLPIPDCVGGRFSVLSPVGLFPALFAGIEVDALRRGAIFQREEILRGSCEHPLSMAAFTLFELWRREGIDQTVMMPYAGQLAPFSCWFVQLWAESLGKKHNRQGGVAHSGLTPIPACGTADQHSQMQLFLEGPRNKCLLVVEVEKLARDFSLANSEENDFLQKLTPFSLGQLLRAELEGSLRALREANRPYLRLKLEFLAPESLGTLIFTCEALTALMGEYFNVDVFIQPGVEKGKQYAFEFLETLTRREI